MRFDGPEGNIDYKRLGHTWVDGHCGYCGAAQKNYDRDKSLGRYACGFIYLGDPG